MGQYSIPFCVALSSYFDPTDPASFDAGKLKDKKIAALMGKIRLEVDHEIEEKGWDRAARLTIELADRPRESKLVIHFKGTPGNPLSDAEVEAKARKLTRGIITERQLVKLVGMVQQLEKVTDVSQVGDMLRGGK